MRSTDDLAANLETCKSLTAKAAADGARLVVLPECFSFLGRGERDKLAIAEPTDGEGPIMTMLRDTAAKHGVWIVGGGTPERIPGDPKRTFNTALAIDPRGEVVARYRKIHLFDVDIPGGTTLRESDATAAGDEVVVVEMDGAKVGLSICYDLRFAHLYRALAHDGADVLAVPAAFTRITGQAHWHVLNRARAIENGAFVLAPCQFGTLAGGAECYGHSLIIDPWGRVLADGGEEEGFIVAELDLAEVEAARARIPSLTHDRPIAIGAHPAAAE